MVVRRTVYPLRKRALDVLLVVAGAFLTVPIALVVAALVRFQLGSPVLFRQERPGLQGRPFTLLKFRTMRQAVDEHGELLRDADRLESFGRLLRSTSLDELPSLLNVLRGEMSLVGPRPLLTEYLPLYSSEQARRHEMPPGVTGWAQVNGRNALAWEDKLAMDVWYIDHWSLRLDLRILLMTVVRLIRREGINQPGHVTIEKFRGSGRPRPATRSEHRAEH